MATVGRNIVGATDGGRPEHDFYLTPPEGTLGLLKVESFIGDIWEPACGNGAMSKVLESAGYKVISTDLKPRGYGSQGDFFFYGSLLAPNIVTNPPFRLAQEFADRALALGCDKLDGHCAGKDRECESSWHVQFLVRVAAVRLRSSPLV